MNTTIQIARQLTDLIYMQGIGSMNFEKEFTVQEAVNVPVIAELSAKVNVTATHPETGHYDTQLWGLEIKSLYMQMPGSEEYEPMPADFIREVENDIYKQYNENQ